MRYFLTKLTLTTMWTGATWDQGIFLHLHSKNLGFKNKIRLERLNLIYLKL